MNTARIARQLRQMAMNYAQHWPLETQGGLKDFQAICSILGLCIAYDKREQLLYFIKI